MLCIVQGIKFPIISDRDGDFSRAAGVLKLQGGQFGAARCWPAYSAVQSRRRAVLVLDPELRLVHLALRNERTRARPGDALEVVRRLQETGPSAIAASAASTPRSLSVLSRRNKNDGPEEGGPDTRWDSLFRL